MNDCQSVPTELLEEVFDIFRSALAALVPVMERACIPWSETDSYDDWDAIASTLFQNIVINHVLEGLDDPDSFSFPEYDVVYPRYEGLAYFRVLSRHSGELLGPFVGLEASDPEFDRVKYTTTDDGVTYDTNRLASMPLSNCRIQLILPSARRNGSE